MKYFFIILIFAGNLPLHAQDIFLTSGKIEFEKRVNTIKTMEDVFKRDDDDGGRSDFFSSMIKQIPEWNTTYFDLYFDNNKTLYEPGKEVTTNGPKGPGWFQDPAQDNIVFSNLDTKERVSKKSVYETTFLLNDSLRKLRWKITNDSRDIAGFNCRKATTIINDSVFVVAFYTDQIIPSGGPESFNGLPGMILGLAIPRLHTTWYATKVETAVPTASIIIPPNKGKKGTSKDLSILLQSRFKNDDWNKNYGQHAQWVIEL
ncbi:MAG: GLPGLI family protein [Bacteroidetes bacterium]|nr:GLPGLI family protein [Bacteroidota bacterium]